MLHMNTFKAVFVVVFFFGILVVVCILYLQTLIQDIDFIHAGDQGFLNSYYADFANSRVYEPNNPSTPEPETQRLSTLYNADVGLYMLANKVLNAFYTLIVLHTLNSQGFVVLY